MVSDKSNNILPAAEKLKNAMRQSALGPLLGMIAIYILFSLLAPSGFSTAANLQTIARQSVIVGMAAIGMTLIIISGGIDLSVGSSIALTTVITAALLQRYDAHPLLAALGGILAGGIAGCLNGLIIARLKMAPFIVTLGTMLLIRGVAKGIANEQKIDAPMTYLNNLLAARAGWHWPPGVWLTIGLTIAAALMLRYTVFGRHIVAVGSNQETARLCGIRIALIKTAVYTLGGLFAGMAGLMQFSRLTVGDPTVAIGKELDVIAAVVIGGGSLAGGEGSIFGSLTGAIIMTIIRSGCSQMGMHNWIQEIVTGVIIVIAVGLDRLRHNSAG